MKAEAYSIVPLDPETITEWLLLSGPNSEQYRREILEDILCRPEIRRFLVRDTNGIVARFSIELSRVGLTTWCPRSIEALSVDAKSKIFAKITEFITLHAKDEGIAYIECTLKGVNESVNSWKAALIAQGFQIVSKKCEWTKDIQDDISQPFNHSNSDIVIEEYNEINENISNLYWKTLERSLDHSNVFEAEYGEGLGEFDVGFVAVNNSEMVGLCACDMQQNSQSGWIKYVGTSINFRRRGIARLLMLRAIHSFRLVGIKIARSLIDECNQPSMLLHQGLMFQKTKTCGESAYFKVR
jgi:ribosomal protein S18 acetylase RimI-like enzyme